MDADNRCEASTSCVSPSAWKSPAQYMPAWSFQPSSKATAFRQAQAVLHGLEVDGKASMLQEDPETGYFKARLQFSIASALPFSTPFNVAVPTAVTIERMLGMIEVS